ncbi:hypothetical protein [Streptomyces sp. NPDC005507]|uniref:hypothetical protein n=1 Tax=unclassified Streptomyces TaxID=2593676 RepID=UPI0032480585
MAQRLEGLRRPVRAGRALIAIPIAWIVAVSVIDDLAPPNIHHRPASAAPGGSDIQRRETALCARLPTLVVTDRIVGLRTVKRVGHLLGSDGRRTGVQLTSPW